MAIQRKYEAVRRLWLLSEKPDGDAISRDIAHKKKYRSRRKRVNLFEIIFFPSLPYNVPCTLQKFDNRKCMVRENEQQYWRSLTLDCMTEESDGDEGCIIEHKIPWRSPGTHT